jgi:hypothetical protein
MKPKPPQTPPPLKPLALRRSESTHPSRTLFWSKWALVGLPRDLMGEDSCANIEMKSNGH